MTIEKKLNGTELTLAISGRMDTSTAPQMEAVVEELTGVKELVLDCAELEYVSSAGLRVIMKAQKKMAEAGSMKVINVNETIMEVFEITGFDSFLTIE